MAKKRKPQGSKQKKSTLKGPPMDALKAFIRKHGPELLKRPNVTSVGIGEKITGTKPTGELSVQFTVGRKVAPEALEAIGTEELPKSFVIAGVEVPTDVLERTFEKQNNRKTAIDPIVPGVSVGHPTISAGTVGCVVYDAKNGAPYILSNWHVLHGPKGRIGDNIVQPGSHDDNRVQRNIVGRLVRSHLAVAGDCAIATIDHRRLDPVIMGLGVTVDQIDEPKLKDKVVKSGRTTGVTYGIVNRVHIIVKLDYDEAGEHEIGCFEIGPDPKFPPADGEISMGGDSGAAWVRANGKAATSTMLGLHFAGEVGDQPEHALACYAESVFEKLEIKPSVPPVLQIAAEAAVGYSPTFVSNATIPLPSAAGSAIKNDLLVVGGDTVIDYMHFSLAMSVSRKFARWVAWNIDGGSLRKVTRKGIPFKKDPDVPAKQQIGNELYAGNRLDRGHIARRADLVWGSLAEARKANVDSFFYTNITPQHEAFNQSDAHGIWGELENAIFADVDVENLHVSVMGGPIFGETDPTYRGCRLPKQFWKIIYFREAGATGHRAKGYVLTQADLLNQLEVLELPEFSVYEVSISQIEDLTGLRFDDGSSPEMIASPRGPESSGTGGVRRIASVREIVG